METYLFNFTTKKAGVYHTELSFCENLNGEQKIFCVIYECCKYIYFKFWKWGMEHQRTKHTVHIYHSEIR